MRCTFLPTIRGAGIGTALLGALMAAPVQADVTINGGATLARDNNVNGSPDTPTKANQRGDNYLSVTASAVYFTPLDAAQTQYFIGQVGAMSSAYHTFSNLDSSMLMASAGLYKQLTSTWSAQFTGRGFARDTKQTERNSDGLGGTLEIKNQLSPTVWVKGIADYEDNKANLTSFSYSGASYGVTVGYLPRPDTFISVGYSQARRDFKSTTPFVATAQTLFFEVTQHIAKNWYLTGGYAHRDNDSNVTGTKYTNNTLSAGLNFSF